MWQFWGNPDHPEESTRLPVDDVLQRIDNTSPLHNLMMVGHIDEKLEMSRKHLDAYRRKGLGMKPAKEKQADDEVKILSTGNVHVTQAPKAANGTGKLLATGLAVAAALGIPAAGAIGYLLNQSAAAKPVVPVVEPGTETDFVPGFLRIEDLVD